MSFEILPGHLLSHLLSPVPVRGLASLSRSSNSLDALVWQNLAELTLSPQTTKDATLIQLSQKPLIHLTTLNLMGCTKITDQGCRNLAKIASLRNLNLKYCDQITDEWIEELVSKLSLSQLNLAYCFQITNISLQILSSAPYLTQLDLSDCDEITTEGLAHLSKLKLTHLKLSYCNKLTDESAQVLSIMSSLRFLDLSGCSKISNSALICLSKILDLAILDIRYCPLISRKGINEIEEKNKSLVLFDTIKDMKQVALAR